MIDIILAVYCIPAIALSLGAVVALEDIGKGFAFGLLWPFWLLAAIVRGVIEIWNGDF